MPGRILVGTSSWADPGFVKDWYPEGMAARDRLPWYADRFQAVELNSSFYAIPERRTVARWAEVTPERFTFDVKLHRLLSRHSAQLDSLPPDMRDGAETTGRGRVKLTPELEEAVAKRLLEEIAPLEEAGKLGALLLQLTPAFSPKEHELDELDPLIEALSPRAVAIELRNRGWVDDERVPDTLSWLSEHDAAFVCVDAPRAEHMSIMPPIDAVTRDDLAYVRIHGRDAEAYTKGTTVAERFGWIYGDDELEEIAGRAHALAEDAGEVHVFFNNNRDETRRARRASSGHCWARTRGRHPTTASCSSASVARGPGRPRAPGGRGGPRPGPTWETPTAGRGCSGEPGEVRGRRAGRRCRSAGSSVETGSAVRGGWLAASGG